MSCCQAQHPGLQHVMGSCCLQASHTTGLSMFVCVYCPHNRLFSGTVYALMSCMFCKQILHARGVADLNICQCSESLGLWLIPCWTTWLRDTAGQIGHRASTVMQALLGACRRSCNAMQTSCKACPWRCNALWFPCCSVCYAGREHDETPMTDTLVEQTMIEFLPTPPSMLHINLVVQAPTLCSIWHATARMKGRRTASHLLKNWSLKRGHSAFGCVLPLVCFAAARRKAFRCLFSLSVSGAAYTTHDERQHHHILIHSSHLEAEAAHLA